MEKIFNWIKEHPALTATVAILVLVVIFWPRGAQQSSGTRESVQAADVIARGQQAAATLQLSSDQVRAVGIEAAAAQAIKESDNAAAIAIATLENQTARHALDTELAASQGAATTSLALAKIDQTTTLAGQLAQALPQTQANSIAGGQQTDAAGFGLLEMFRNIMNADKNIAATQTLITTNSAGTAATVYESGKTDPQSMTYTGISKQKNGFGNFQFTTLEDGKTIQINPHSGAIIRT